MIKFKGKSFEREVILWGVRWYVAYPISYRQLEEMMDERGVEVDHSTLNRWVLKYVPLLEAKFRARKRPVGSSWRLDETYVKVKGVWKYPAVLNANESRFSIAGRAGCHSVNAGHARLGESRMQQSEDFLLPHRDP